jgi:hypothetical protein
MVVLLMLHYNILINVLDYTLLHVHMVGYTPNVVLTNLCFLC